jgi:hypothetical protein
VAGPDAFEKIRYLENIAAGGPVRKEILPVQDEFPGPGQELYNPLAMNLVRHCAQCDTDYRPHVAVCAECGGPLQERLEGATDALETAAPPPSPAEHLPPGEYQTLYYSYNAADLTALAARLTRRGIPFRLETIAEDRGRRLPTSRFELAVRDAERQSAREELLYLLGPEAPSDAARSLDRDFDPETGYRRCPGCSTDLSQGQGVCPECGLVLGGDPTEAGCGRCACGMEPGPHDEQCPRCGCAVPD